MKKLICIIITLIMTLSLFPVNAAADDTVYRISIDNKGNLSITPEPSNPDSVYSWSGGESTGELVLLSGYKFNLDITSVFKASQTTEQLPMRILPVLPLS